MMSLDTTVYVQVLLYSLRIFSMIQSAVFAGLLLVYLLIPHSLCSFHFIQNGITSESNGALPDFCFYWLSKGLLLISGNVLCFSY